MTVSNFLVIISLVILVISIVILISVRKYCKCNNSASDLKKSSSIKSSVNLGSGSTEDMLQAFINGFNLAWPGYAMNYGNIDRWEPSGGILIPFDDATKKSILRAIKTAASLTVCLTCTPDSVRGNGGTFRWLDGLRNLYIDSIKNIDYSRNIATYNVRVKNEGMKAYISDPTIDVRCHCGFPPFEHNDWHNFGKCSSVSASINFEDSIAAEISITFDPSNIINSFIFTNFVWVKEPKVKSNFSGCKSVAAIADFFDDVFGSNILGGSLSAQIKSIQASLVPPIMNCLNDESKNLKQLIINNMSS